MTVQPPIVPFRIAMPQHRLDWIADRLRAYPWDAIRDAGGWGAGTAIAFLRDLTDYWLNGYDWRAQEAWLNRFPQFLATVGEHTIHFYHVKGSGRRNRPLLLLHGWPGSIFEFDRMIEPLLSPDERGYAFDLVIPSLPGFGFSRGLARPIGPREVARIMATLMRMLGYERYVSQGGDWGAMIATQLGIHHSTECRAIHLNMVVPGTAPAETTEELAWAARIARIAPAEMAYGRLQMTRPQSLAFAMTDSPVGVAGWIIEKFAAWSDLPRDSDGSPALLRRYSRDQLITNLMFYLAPDSFATATWLYHGLFLHPEDAPFVGGRRCETPTAVTAFPDPIFPPPPRSLADKSYAIARWTPMREGGHFAAMEAPLALADDVRAFASLIDP